MDGDGMRARAIEVLELGAAELGPRGGRDLSELAGRLRSGAPFIPLEGRAEAAVRSGLGEAASGHSNLRDGISAAPDVAFLRGDAFAGVEAALAKARADLAAGVTYGTVISALTGTWANREVSDAIRDVSAALRDDVLARRARETLAWAGRLYREGSGRALALREAAARVGQGRPSEWGEAVCEALQEAKEPGGDLADAILALEADLGRSTPRFGR